MDVIIYKCFNNKYFFSVLLLLFFVGCASVPAYNPIAYNSYSRGTIAFANMSMEPDLLDKEIGRSSWVMFWGLFAVPQDTYYGSKALEPKSSFPLEIEKELRNANYPVLNTHESTPHSDSEKLAKADLLIGATITDIEYNNYPQGSFLYKTKSKTEVTVKWQVLDNHSKKIIYEKKTTGFAKGAPNSTKCIVDAVVISFKEILADKQFAETVTKKIGNM